MKKTKKKKNKIIEIKTQIKLNKLKQSITKITQ